MADTESKTHSVFFPEHFSELNQLHNQDMRFVQYTTAESAMRILSSEEVWLRNVRCMNDYSEVQHGINCLSQTFAISHPVGDYFKQCLQDMFPGSFDRFIQLFNPRIEHFLHDTYIACVSEHLPSEDIYGRLSMWRAYGGNHPVALVFNTTAFRAETDALKAYTGKVKYLSQLDLEQEINKLTQRMKGEAEFIIGLGEDQFLDYLFLLFRNYALFMKHPGFKEEREWRVFYNPSEHSSQYVLTSIETINGLPQEVYKIPLKNIPEEKFFGASIPELINKVIIGPCDQPLVIGKTFIRMLESRGCSDAFKMVSYSQIPLRQR